MPRINVVIAGDAAKLNKALAASERRMRKFASGLKTVGDGIFTAVGVPFIAAGAAGVNSAAELETAFGKIKNLVGITGGAFKELQETVSQVSNETGKSQRELADGMFVITSAGLRGKDAAELLRASAKASAIGMGEVNDIARASSAIMTAYASSGMTAARATDLLTLAVREGNMEAAELAPAIGKVLPIANELGISFEEVGANVATFTRLGIPATEAVTALRSTLNALGAPTIEARKRMEELGISGEILRQKLSTDGLAATMQWLIELTGGNIEKLREIVPSVEGLVNVLGTAKNQGEAYAQVLQNMSDKSAVVADGFDNVSEESAQKFKQAITSLQNASIELGAILMPMARDIADSIRNLAEWFRALDDDTKENIVSALKWTTLIAGGTSIVGRMVSGVANLSKAFRDLGGAKAIAAVVSGFKALTTTGTTANIAVRMLGIGLKTLWVSAIAPLAIAVGTLTASLEGLTRAMTMNNEIGNAARQMFTQNEVVRTLTTGYWKLKESLFGVKEGQEKVEETGTDMNEMLGALNLNVSNTADALKDTAVKTTELTEAQKKNLQTLADLRKELDFINKKQELFGENLGEEKIDAYTSAIEELLRNGLNPMSTAVQKLKGEMDALYKSMMPKTDPLKKIQSGSERFGLPGAIEGGETGLVPPKGLIGTNYDNNTPGDIQRGKSADELAKIAAAFDMASNAGQRFADIFQDAAESTGSAVEKMGKVIMGVAKEIIKSALLSALSQWIASSMTKLGIFGVPIAGAGYGIIQGLFNKGNGFNVPALAEGGMTTRAGYAMIGDNPSGKEFVIPYEKMGDFARRAMGGSNMNLSGQFVVRGSDLVLALERENRKLINQRGYGLNQ